ncbi:MAG: hypothetical protein IJM23_02425 [Lachnospiraceae bacterium]|nr:hypothetical protein [Lachnospiraceae bacterium]
MKRNCLIIYVLVCLIFLGGCGEAGDYSAKQIADELVNTPINELVGDTDANGSNTEEQTDKSSKDSGDSDTSEYANEKKRYKVGETFIYDQCEIVITETNVCEDSYDGERYVEVLYSVKNIGNIDVIIAYWSFNAYADDYHVDTTDPISDNRQTVGTLSHGRKMDAVLRIRVDPYSVKCIELEPADSDIVIDLQDVDKGIFVGGVNSGYDSVNAVNGESDNRYTDEKWDYDYDAMNYAGHYEGKDYSVDFYAYSDVDGDEIGTADLFYQGNYISSEPVYLVSDMSSWSDSGYEALYAIYTEDGATYLGFYEMNGTIYMDFNSDSATMDTLEMIGSFSS